MSSASSWASSSTSFRAGPNSMGRSPRWRSRRPWPPRSSDYTASAACPKLQIAVVAVARELVGFFWADMQDLEPQTIAACTGGPSVPGGTTGRRSDSL